MVNRLKSILKRGKRLLKGQSSEQQQPSGPEKAVVPKGNQQKDVEVDPNSNRVPQFSNGPFGREMDAPQDRVADYSGDDGQVSPMTGVEPSERSDAQLGPTSDTIRMVPQTPLSGSSDEDQTLDSRQQQTQPVSHSPG